MMMKKLFVLVLFLGVAFSQSAQIIDNANTVQDVYSSTAFKVYADTFGVNPDFALRLCGAGQRYVAATYSANLGGGNYVYTAISKNLTAGSSDTLVYTPNNLGGGCYATPVDAYAFSQFRDFTRTPPVFVSAFPGRIHVMYSNSVTGSSPTFIGVDMAEGYLRGGYSVTRSFNQATNRVSANVNSITFETDFGSITRNPSDPEWGLNSSTGRSMLLALCNDDIGDTCSDGIIVNATGDLPAQLLLGSPTNDQVIYNRYVVVDGLGYPICIGADVSTGIIAIPNNIYYGANTSATITLTNVGNVNITTDFVLDLNITGPGGYTHDVSWTITETLIPGGSTTRNYNWTADGPNGAYTFTARADSHNDLVECNKLNNNASTVVNVAPIYILHVEIDGNETYTFPYWGRPYNVTMWVTDNNNNTIPGARYVITEHNGLNPFVPTQVWNDSGVGRGLIVDNRGEMTGNGTGYVRMTLVPTCNLLYTTYVSENVAAYVGDYYIVVNVYNGPSQITFLYNSTFTQNPRLIIGNWTCVDPGWVNDKELINKDTYVLWIYDWLYEVYSITKKLVVP